MSNVVKFPDIDRIEQQACDWIARIDRSTLSELETQELHQWLREDPRHAQSLIEMAELLDRMSVLSRVSSLFPLEEQMLSGPKSHRRFGIRNHLRPLTAGLAAVMVSLVVLWNFQSFEPSETIAPGIVNTNIGEQKTVILADGSQVTINTDSHISFEFDDKQRRVILERGEAMFEVVHDGERPFLVEADGNVVKAVGTAFNIEIATNGIEVTVTDGVVEVATLSANEPAKRSNPFTGEASPKSLQVTQVDAGHVVLIEKTVKDLKPIDTAVIDAKLAWQRGELVFEGEPLEWVVAEVSRYTNQSLIIIDDRIRDIPIGGRFDIREVENLLDILDHGFNIEVTKSRSGQFYLSARE